MPCYFNFGINENFVLLLALERLLLKPNSAISNFSSVSLKSVANLIGSMFSRTHFILLEY